MTVEIINFFIKPDLQKATSLKQKFANLFVAVKFTLIGYTILVVSLTVGHLISKHLDWGFSIMDTTYKFSNSAALQTPWKIFLFGVILIPILEELAFRGFFNLKKIFIALSTGCLTYIFLKTILFFLPKTDMDTTMSLILSLAVFLTSFIWINDSVVNFINKNFKPIFYFSNIYFVSMHAFNYKLSDFSTLEFFVLPILLIPQMIGALNFSFIRIRNGLLWSILFHSAENLIFFLPSIIKGLK